MPASTAIDAVQNARRLVIKIGSSLLVDGATGELRTGWLKALARDVAALRAKGTQVIIVSSGAIALGRRALGFDPRSARLEEAQAATAVGQIRLGEAYQTIFGAHDMIVGQLLLTIHDLETRPSYLNARNTIEELMDCNVLPVINENDTVATTEMRFGDNDRLGARVAQMANADTLVLLSDIDGLYDRDPRTSEHAKFLERVDEITPAIEAMAGPPATQSPGSGGMVTKLQAAKIALAGGCTMIIMNGGEDGPIGRLHGGCRATLFTTQTDPLTVRKQWIRSLMAPKGFLHIDHGAANALRKGASLLPAGVTEVDGLFERGDLVAIMGPDGHLVGQGLTAYSAEHAAKMCGRQMHESHEILGHAGRSALIHRDDMVLF
jgi:glutamate 5-kinase